MTTCAYCGVGCSFRAEMKGEELVRLVPNKNGAANHGHSCVKGRFAIGYATHPDRIIKPMIRAGISDPWREVSWEEAIAYAAAEFKRIQTKYGRDTIGGITSSRCTNEETYLVQKLVIHFVLQFCASRNIAPTSAGAIIAVQLCIFAAGTILFFAVERPFLQLRHRVVSRSV